MNNLPAEYWEEKEKERGKRHRKIEGRRERKKVENEIKIFHTSFIKIEWVKNTKIIVVATFLFKFLKYFDVVAHRGDGMLLCHGLYNNNMQSGNKNDWKISKYMPKIIYMIKIKRFYF